MPIIFCMIANATVPVAQYEENGTGSSSEVATEAEALRKKIKLAEDGKNADVGHAIKGSTFCWIVDEEMLFLCLVTGKSGKVVAYQFLEKVKDQFYDRFGVRGKATKLRLDMNMDFVPVMKKMLTEMNKNEAGLGKIADIKADVDKVTDSMKSNINKALERGEQIETLVTKTDSLNTSSEAFRNSSRTLRRNLWWQNAKLMILAGVGFVLFFVLFLWWVGAI